jgi:hypothetical protein
MIEVCPRCSSRLGPPLKSGRQVCATCGWSSEPSPQRKRSSSHAAQSRQASAWQEIALICGRIIRRSVVYVWQQIQLLLQRLRVSQNSVQPHQLASGLKKRLSAIEEAIPTSPTSAENLVQPWMTLEEAFQYLGGDFADPRSTVMTLDGSDNFNFQSFSRLKSVRDFKTFGLEADLLRRAEDKPWLRSLI